MTRISESRMDFIQSRLRTIVQITGDTNPRSILQRLQRESAYNCANDILEWLQDGDRGVYATTAVRQSQAHMRGGKGA